MEKNECAIKFQGSVTMGPRGQIVIPKNVRDYLGLEEGTQLMLVTQGGVAIGLVKADNRTEVMKYVQQEENHHLLETK